MRVMVAQLNPIIGDFEGNTRKAIQAIDHARSNQMDLVVFSELFLCGYPPEDLLFHSSFIDANQKYLEKVVQTSKGIMVVIGVVRKNPAKKEKPIFNSAAVIHDGRLLGFEDKRLLPTYDVFDERRYFEPGTTTQIWKIRGKKIGVMICEDMWQHAGFVADTNYAHDPVQEFRDLKPDVILNLSSSPYQFQKPSTRAKVCATAAKALKCPVILCCQVGANDQLVFDGYSLYVDSEGKLAQIAKGFEEDEMIIDLEAKTHPCSFSYEPIHDLYQALVLGVRDYFHKQGFKKGCLGLSGGIDSALVACIAADALGKENVFAITMPSRYSSAGSVTDSEALASRLGIECLQISIEKPFQAFLDLLQPHFKEKAADITEENLQARIRGMILMAISNKHGYIVMSTGNKSEMGLGYCTLYGDMAGGLGVISDVTKKQVYALACYINREKEVIPQSIIGKDPSAELKPNQRDTDSLPEYDIVDKVLEGYVEEYSSPEEIAKKYALPIETVLDLIYRIHRAEYKRRQAAPEIRVSKKAFRAGRRYPIVQRWM